ncbi:Kae1-associated kinase Bud32 [Candidatus Pacearchaeota archaeon CG10_big_fil_rev_8_21_14_0_10_34_76]|nr:MAG: Kae1-associated kinase Bud32 [Candidatus Pacearchaeota archaeon CG10_big_fil_rev_8_21_14_0_10_34_76]
MNYKEKTVARGAEAIVYKLGSKVVKDRIPKGYRHPDLDNKLRTRRTKSEEKLLSKASEIVSTPKPLITSSSSDNYKIHMPYIPGKKLSEHLDKLKNYQTICKKIGQSLAKLHDAGLIHGDLTTSNLILTKNNKVFFIDFGLGFHSTRIEDKAVDLHLISQALEAKHSSIHEKAFKSILQGYKSSKNYQETIKRLEKVESRGRYKKQY